MRLLGILLIIFITILIVGDWFGYHYLESHDTWGFIWHYIVAMLVAAVLLIAPILLIVTHGYWAKKIFGALISVLVASYIAATLAEYHPLDILQDTPQIQTIGNVAAMFLMLVGPVVLSVLPKQQKKSGGDSDNDENVADASADTTTQYAPTTAVPTPHCPSVSIRELGSNANGIFFFNLESSPPPKKNTVFGVKVVTTYVDGSRKERVSWFACLKGETVAITFAVHNKKKGASVALSVANPDRFSLQKPVHVDRLGCEIKAGFIPAYTAQTEHPVTILN